MPGITKEQRIAFIQKYSSMFDEEVLVDQGAFKGFKVKDADRALVENFGQQSSVERVLEMISITNKEEVIQQAFSEFYDDPKYTFLAMRHHLSCEGSIIVGRYTGKQLPPVATWGALQKYAKSHGYQW